VKVALYARVSTKDQDCENQIRELRQWAHTAGHEIVEIYQDNGISGSKGRDKRPEFDRLLKDAVRRKFKLVASWGLDRLGRSMKDLVNTLSDLRDVDCGIYLHKQAIDTTTKEGKMLFHVLGMFAEFELDMISERIKAGLARAASEGRFPGRPKLTDDKIDEIKAMRKQGHGIRKTAKALKCGVGTIQRLEATSP